MKDCVLLKFILLTSVLFCFHDISGTLCFLGGRAMSMTNIVFHLLFSSLKQNTQYPKLKQKGLIQLMDFKGFSL